MNGNRTGKGWFPPGVSGNPGGRPKQVTAAKRLAIEVAPLCIETLLTIVRHCHDDRARIAACREILDRALGRPSPAVEAMAIPDNCGLRKFVDGPPQESYEEWLTRKASLQVNDLE